MLPASPSGPPMPPNSPPIHDTSHDRSNENDVPTNVPNLASEPKENGRMPKTETASGSTLYSSSVGRPILGSGMPKLRHRIRRLRLASMSQTSKLSSTGASTAERGRRVFERGRMPKLPM